MSKTSVTSGERQTGVTIIRASPGVSIRTKGQEDRAPEKERRRGKKVRKEIQLSIKKRKTS